MSAKDFFEKYGKITHYYANPEDNEPKQIPSSDGTPNGDSLKKEQGSVDINSEIVYSAERNFGWENELNEGNIFREQKSKIIQELKDFDYTSKRRALGPDEETKSQQFISQENLDKINTEDGNIPSFSETIKNAFGVGHSLFKDGYQNAAGILSDGNLTQPNSRDSELNISSPSSLQNLGINTSDTIETQTLSFLEQYNRFRPAGAFSENGEIPNNFSGYLPASVQLATGAIKGPMGRYATDETKIKTFDYEELKKTGLSLMIRACGVDTSSDPTSGAVQALAGLLPGVAQLGVSIPMNRMRPLNAYGIPEDRAKAGGDFLGYAVDSQVNSFGSYNNNIAYYESFLSAIMTGLILVAFDIVLAGVITGFTMINGAGDVGKIAVKAARHDGAIQKVGVRNAFRRYVDDDYNTGSNFPLTDSEGSDAGDSSSQKFVAALLRKIVGNKIYIPKYAYAACLREGAKILYGLDFSEPAAFGTSLLDSLTENMLDSTQFNLVLLRAIIRNAEAVANKFSDLVNPNLGGGAFEKIDQTIESIKAIFESKLMGIINVMVQLGDASLFGKEHPNPYDSNGQFVGYGDLDDDNPLMRIMLSREPKYEFQEKRSKLTWRGNVRNNALMLPQNVLVSQLLIGQFNADYAYTLNNPIIHEEIINKDMKRIPYEVVEKMEGALDAEYVPFYFQDLRTNEFLAFHAFLETLSESYAVNYNSVDGFGRIDSVKLYNKTDRSLSLSFTVASTSEQDFDDMYVKINKLVTLVYPQWTEGRKISRREGTTTDSFTQPFSQLPGASPLIRLRIGDLIKGNYSKFAISRIFGFGGETKLQSETDSIETAPREAVQETATSSNYIKAKQDLENFINGNYENLEGVDIHLRPGSYFIKKIAGTASAVAGAAAAVGLTEPENDPAILTINNPYDYSFTVKETKEGTPDKINLNFKINDDNYETDVHYSEILDFANDSINVSFIKESISEENRTKIDEFLDPAENPIIRSFQATAGKGLAGVITSLNIEWPNHTWETTWGSVAPKFCKITIAFAPVHDIPPGLDSDGFNRAPLYNTGRHMHKIAADGPYPMDKDKNPHLKWRTEETSGKLPAEQVQKYINPLIFKKG